MTPHQRQQAYARIVVGQAVDVAARACGVTREHILSHVRARRSSRPRRLAYWLAWTHSECSWPQLAREFGRDHSTLIVGVRRFEREVRQPGSWANLAMVRVSTNA